MTIRVQSLSPSRIHYTEECIFRYVQSLREDDIKSNGNSKVYSYHYSPNIFLGQIAHGVLETFVKKQYSVESFDKVWTYEFKKQQKLYGKGGVSDIQLQFDMPFYSIKKAKLKDLIVRLFINHKGSVYAEKSKGNHLARGKIDIIIEYKDSKKIEIIDLKTGSFWNFKKGKRAGIKDAYRKQLLTYGYMFWKEGVSASLISCGLQGLDYRNRYSTFFTDDEYKTHENTLSQLLKNVNTAYEFTREKVSLHASPSPSVCRYCEYATVCRALHKEMEGDFLNFALLYKSKTIFNLSSKNISVKYRDDDMKVITGVPLNSFESIRKLVKEGKQVFISGLFEEDESEFKKWTRFTEFSAVNYEF